MLKWLEYENWGDAFLSVIPKRKGGQLRQQEGASGEVDEDEGEEGESEAQEPAPEAETEEAASKP